MCIVLFTLARSRSYARIVTDSLKKYKISFDMHRHRRFLIGEKQLTKPVKQLVKSRSSVQIVTQNN